MIIFLKYTYPILEYSDGKILKKQASALLSLNMRLRDDIQKIQLLVLKDGTEPLKILKLILK